jgi:hypothetical protein
MSEATDPRVREAFEELDRYLADQVAPLFAAEALEVLLDLPAEIFAEALYGWAAAQYRARGGGDPLADLIFHAVQKIQLFEEFNLLPAERFSAFLSDVAGTVVGLVPEGERERLTGMLTYLHTAKGATVPTVEHLRRAPANPAGSPRNVASPALSEAELSSLHRFSLLLERLAPAGAGAPSADQARQLLVLAASGATSPEELEGRIARLQAAGAAPAVSRELVRSLSAAVPDWVVRRGEGVEVVGGASVEAVRRVVKLAGDGARKGERWKDLLRAVAESFNEGAFSRAVTLLDLAERMAAEGEVEKHVADMARGAAHQGFDMVRVLQATADPANRPILRRLAGFLTAWSIPELLDSIVFQPDQKKRRMTLALLEVWGVEARQPVFDRLALAVAEPSRDPDAWWHLRNLVYLMHRLPRPEKGTDPKLELALVAPFSQLGEHPSFQRETFTLLGQLPGGAGAGLLVQRLAEIERSLEGTVAPPHPLPEMWKVLNTLAGALVRTGSPGARRALAEHGLAKRPRAGDSTARLRELRHVDLSGDREVVGRLLQALRSLQPARILGFVGTGNEEALANVVRALSRTSDPEVRRALAGIAERFPERDAGRLAAAALAGAPAEEAVPEEEGEEFLPPPPPAEPTRARASLSGDLEVFGLPGLLQNLQQSESSGRLVIRTAAGAERALLELAEGRLASCRCSHLTGDAAFYQIFETPSPGTFEFTRVSPGTIPVPAGGGEVIALLMEAMRRFDEFQRLQALVPDRAVLAPGEGKPLAPPGESDGELIRRLWSSVRRMATTAECEQEGGVDAYRARAVLAYWLEQGALLLKFGDASPA